MTTRSRMVRVAIADSVGNVAKKWKETYLLLATALLTSQRYVSGDDFTAFCRSRGLWEPDSHNRWVRMPAILESKGWITPLVKVRPLQGHNHMPEVAFYRSTLFEEVLPDFRMEEQP